MPRPFRIARDLIMDAPPDEVFTAVTVETAAWRPPEPGGPPGRVVAWDPPRHASLRTDLGDDGFRAVECLVGTEKGGSTTLRYVHSGVFTGDWDQQYDAAVHHTDFHLHSLREYLSHFAGRDAVVVSARGSRRLKRDFRAVLEVDAVGQPAALSVPGLKPAYGVVDYLDDTFIGIRSSDALYRFYDRTRWAGTCSVTHHLFGDVDREEAVAAWQNWLDGQAA